MKSSDPIAPLRKDLEVLEREDGTIDIRDPFLLQVFTLDAEEVEVARRFDGEQSAKALAKLLRRRGQEGARTKDILQIAESFRELALLDLPEVLEREPVVDNATPFTVIESSHKKLRVLPEPELHARWSCGACGACCHGLAVEVNEEEESRIDASLYEDVLDGKPFVEEAFIDPDRPAQRILRQRHDKGGACVFLGADGLCVVHARQGMEAKPDACQIFPNMVIHVPGKRSRLAMRTNCRTMHESFETGQAVEEHRDHVLRLLETSGGYKIPKKMPIFGQASTYAASESIRERFNDTFASQGVTAEAIAYLDATTMGGRVHKARRQYGKRMLAYLEAENSGDTPVEQGNLSDFFAPVKRSRKALAAMKGDEAPPTVPEPVQRFLRAQMRNVLYAAGPMTFPDAGFGFAALLLALEGVLHSVGKKGSLKDANDAFIAFTMPIIETTAHAWPILDALDRDYAKQLRKEL